MYTKYTNILENIIIKNINIGNFGIRYTSVYIRERKERRKWTIKMR